jgi:hypothetical protein
MGRCYEFWSDVVNFSTQLIKSHLQLFILQER